MLLGGGRLQVPDARPTHGEDVADVDFEGVMSACSGEGHGALRSRSIDFLLAPSGATVGVSPVAIKTEGLREKSIAFAHARISLRDGEGVRDDEVAFSSALAPSGTRRSGPH